jgi:hypothetical protein
MFVMHSFLYTDRNVTQATMKDPGESGGVDTRTDAWRSSTLKQ